MPLRTLKDNLPSLGPSVGHQATIDHLPVFIHKSKSLVIGSSYKLANIDLENRFVLNNIFSERVHSYNYLGVVLNTHMTLNPLLKKVKKTVSCKICSLAKIRNSITLNCALAI